MFSTCSSMSFETDDRITYEIIDGKRRVVVDGTIRQVGVARNVLYDGSVQEGEIAIFEIKDTDGIAILVKLDTLDLVKLKRRNGRGFAKHLKDKYGFLIFIAENRVTDLLQRAAQEYSEQGNEQEFVLSKKYGYHTIGSEVLFIFPDRHGKLHVYDEKCQRRQDLRAIVETRAVHVRPCLTSLEPHTRYFRRLVDGVVALFPDNLDAVLVLMGYVTAAFNAIADKTGRHPARMREDFRYTRTDVMPLCLVNGPDCDRKAAAVKTVMAGLSIMTTHGDDSTCHTTASAKYRSTECHYPFYSEDCMNTEMINDLTFALCNLGTSKNGNKEWKHVAVFMLETNLTADQLSLMPKATRSQLLTVPFVARAEGSPRKFDASVDRLAESLAQADALLACARARYLANSMREEIQELLTQHFAGKKWNCETRNMACRVAKYMIVALTEADRADLIPQTLAFLRDSCFSQGEQEATPQVAADRLSAIVNSLDDEEDIRRCVRNVSNGYLAFNLSDFNVAPLVPLLEQVKKRFPRTACREKFCVGFAPANPESRENAGRTVIRKRQSIKLQKALFEDDVIQKIQAAHPTIQRTPASQSSRTTEKGSSSRTPSSSRSSRKAGPSGRQRTEKRKRPSGWLAAFACPSAKRGLLESGSSRHGSPSPSSDRTSGFDGSSRTPELVDSPVFDSQTTFAPVDLPTWKR